MFRTGISGRGQQWRFSQFGFWAKREEKPNQFMKAEGYLFPDTYEFFVGDTVYNMVAKIYGEFDNKITAEMYARMDELDMTLTEVVTLASLVQEEAGNEYSKIGLRSVPQPPCQRHDAGQQRCVGQRKGRRQQLYL